MLKRSHNEVINIFMNKINHTLAQQCVHLKAKCTSAAPCLHPRTLGGPWVHSKHAARRDLRIMGGIKSVIDVYF